jgi:16S rRNA processing protein RimM
VPSQLVIGIVRSAFGTAGEVGVESLSGETTHFTRLRRVLLRNASVETVYRVESVRVTNKAVLMKLAGIDTRDDAFALRGAEVVVPRSSAASLSAGEYYFADLEGLEVVCNGTPVGRVLGLRDAGASALIEVGREGRPTVLVPFVAAFVGEVNLRQGHLELLDPEVLE